jgi:thiamine-phosphate diphosphorylase
MLSRTDSSLYWLGRYIERADFIARLVEADGVHLGQDDLPVASARRIVGPDAIIGVSTHTLDQVRRAVTDGADYIGEIMAWDAAIGILLSQ